MEVNKKKEDRSKICSVEWKISTTNKNYLKKYEIILDQIYKRKGKQKRTRKIQLQPALHQPD